jgi:prepilin signal peptidase PulO-like enzyme (type II secretory pathway)
LLDLHDNRLFIVLSILPNFVVVPLLAVLGAIIGAAINWAIYSWCYFSRRPFSPWMSCEDPPLVRTSFDKTPVLGWFSLRRHVKELGSGFWVRPLLIETVWAIGLPWFWFWQLGPGLTGGVDVPSLWIETWFWGHTVLIALMFIATFIDFDEKTIPDEITLPGTLFALVMAAAAPWFRLPELVNDMAGTSVRPIHYGSSNVLPDWHLGANGIAVALVIVLIWFLSLLPARYTLRYGLLRGIRITLASIARPKRKSTCPLRSKPRQPLGLTRLLAILWASVSTFVLLGWLLLPAIHWTSLFCSIVGLGFGGGMVWSIRIVASYAMQQEAMGFGDVTLMAMIGAFFGWQPSLLVFAIAPFAALVVVFGMVLLQRVNEIAFGPYLCIGALVLLFGWSTIWNQSTRHLFFMGPGLLVILLAGLVVMAIMLVAIQFVKSIFAGDSRE